jgi:hypothetical protein
MDAKIKKAIELLKAGLGRLYWRVEKLPTEFIGPPAPQLRFEVQADGFKVSCIAERANVEALIARLERGPRNLYTPNTKPPRPAYGLNLATIKSYLAAGDQQLMHDLYANGHPNVYRGATYPGEVLWLIGRPMPEPWGALIQVEQYAGRGKWHPQINHALTGLRVCDGHTISPRITPEYITQAALGREVINGR